LSTKSHATVDALGNPTGFVLTPGQACDLEGADALLSTLEADTLIYRLIPEWGPRHTVQNSKGECGWQGFI
jgi:hypothetical protein